MAGDPHFSFLIFKVQAILYQLAKKKKLKSYLWELITTIVLNFNFGKSVQPEELKTWAYRQNNNYNQILGRQELCCPI